MTGNVLKEIEENIKDYEEQGIEQIPLSLVKYWISVLEKENEQLQKQIKVYEYFLDQNNLDIDWNCLCTANECIFSAEEIDENEIDCKDCKCMELKE